MTAGIFLRSQTDVETEKQAPAPHPQFTSTFSAVGPYEEGFCKGCWLGPAYPKVLSRVFRTTGGSRDAVGLFTLILHMQTARQPMATFLPCVTGNTGSPRFHLVPRQSRAPNAESSSVAVLGKIMKRSGHSVDFKFFKKWQGPSSAFWRHKDIRGTHIHLLLIRLLPMQSVADTAK